MKMMSYFNVKIKLNPYESYDALFIHILCRSSRFRIGEESGGRVESINYMLWREVVLGRLTQIKKDTSADTTQTSQWQIELFSQELCFLFSVRIQSSVKTRKYHNTKTI